MPNLKDLKTRIASVKSTRKITSAMKMVAASKLRRAQELAESSRFYSESLSFILSSLVGGSKESSGLPEVLVGRQNPKVALLILIHLIEAFVAVLILVCLEARSGGLKIKNLKV